MFCHGSTSTALNSAVEYEAYAREITTLAARGIPVISAQLGGEQTWGNDASMTAVTAAWEYLKTVSGCQTDKMLLHGSSMGGQTALRYAKDNASTVAAVTANIPVINADDVHDNRGGLASINAAYGSEAAWDAAKATADPFLFRAAYNTAAVPTKLWAAESDATCIYGYAQTFDTDCTNVELVSLGALSHAQGSTAIDHNQVFDFLSQYT